MSDARRERQAEVVAREADPRIGALLTTVRQTWLPPPKLTVSEFADRELVVTSGPLSGTRWNSDFAPYQRGFMDVFSEPGVEICAIQGSVQFGKTATALALIAYHIAHDPCPILVVEPDEGLAKDISTNRIAPIIAASPALSSRVPKTSRTSKNTILSKKFMGGELVLVGVGGGTAIASRSVRVLILDETGKYKTEMKGEGNTIDVALKRTITYRGRRRILIMSTPTVDGDVIGQWFKRGDQRRYYVPCPECGCMHTYQWANVRWEKTLDGVPITDDALAERPAGKVEHHPDTAKLHCPSCDYGIGDAERVALLSRGEWRSERPENAGKGIASFHIWEAYSPFSSLSEIVARFVEAREAQKAGDNSKMHAWINTTLGEQVLAAGGEGVEAEALLSRVEVYPAPVPKGACILTMGVDTQDDRLEALVIGWGPGEESWLVDYHRLSGDPTYPAPWLALDEVLARTYRREGGGALRIAASCLDTAGHRTTQAYDYVAKHAKLGRFRIHAIIGRPDTPEKIRPLVSKPSPQTWGKGARPVELYIVGVDGAKGLVTQRLALTEPGPGYIHIPTAAEGDQSGAYDWVDLELAEQLASEKLVMKYSRGRTIQKWENIRKRNEMLDCSVYALAALRLARVDLSILHSRMGAMIAQAPEAQPKPQERRVSRSGFLGR